jgi:SecA Wing and Scaffold domain
LQAAQRFFVLTQTDNLWKEHLQAIKFLQQAVSLRGYAQVPCPLTLSCRLVAIGAPPLAFKASQAGDRAP